MHADIQGALDQINRSYKAFEHNGKRMTKLQVIKVLKFGLKRGYKYTSEFKDDEIDQILNVDKNGATQ
jgi:ribulose bisphosphate carboxylase small subunit